VPKKGHQYPIDTDWKDRVRDRILELRISQNELARRARISKAALSDALSAESLQSAFVPGIHRALGWPVPPLVLAPDALELVSLYGQMEERDQGAFVQDARHKVETARRGKKKSN
jgi:transcriptional regulator with XRE-family HTH domain